ncbi:hypothetical protein TVAG_379070 [Trichomonas vaginalis G3]|uniref:Uncharacterized protein n=1 Tax=Trichomonas vaginalis (strain ATCC PRA-98 / G3) TaxID=412133 RepID=A2DB98_TRIV3|nr:hypothetical protein TVAGG3_0508780 [Trichomonas vaginalis G3]EAY22428.1 hypothetical protein TVAG_379070 [Trichomonas vaginalis G3]KAI5517625.1 hypothetical protein TVAGG3_0508780 [Trichomonas vaginalis G3]|eukprot:XP_001583414.1 hypothetical protein [Trichomonas vaginalis G3]
MSVYFTAKPEYFKFIRDLEDEGEEYRQLHHKFQTLAQKSKEEFKQSRNKINAAMNTIKPPVRGIRTAEIPSVLKKKPEKRAATQTANLHPNPIFGQIQNSKIPTTVYHDAVPARSNGAQRILNPKRLQKYRENNREPPMLIGRGVNSIGHDNLNMDSLSLSNYHFDIVN